MRADVGRKGAPRATTTSARRLARISLGLMGALMAVFVMVGPSFGAVSIFAQASPSGSATPSSSASGSTSPSASPSPTAPAEPAIKLLNPSQAYDPNFSKPARAPGEKDPVKVSDKFDGVDTKYHIVAWVKDAPPNVVVEAYIDPDAPFIGETTIGLLDPVPGRPDTYELYWDIPSDMPEGTALFAVRMYEVTGSTTDEVANDELVVDVQHNDSINPQTGANTSPAEDTIELTWPSQNGQLGFYKGRGGAWRTVIDGTLSANTLQRYYLYYTVSAPGTAPVFTNCGSFLGAGAAVNGAKPFSTACPLAGKDTPSQVTAIAAVVAEDDTARPEGGATAAAELTLESADVHRVTPYVQTPDDIVFTLFPAPTAADSGMGRQVANITQCLTFVARARDQLGRPVLGANVDFHIVGPTDSVAFGERENSTGIDGSGSKTPDKGTHSSEYFWDCGFAGEREDDTTAVGNVKQGDTNIPAADDEKHIESTSGTGLNGGVGMGFGEYRIHIRSDRAGFTDITAWIDDEDLAIESENRPLDTDLLEAGEPSDTFQAQWYSTAPTVQFEPAGGTSLVGTCERYIVRVRAGSAPVPNTNLDIHATGPDDLLDFCDPDDASPRRAPDGGPTTTPHESEDAGESSHAGGPRTQHTEGETDDDGNFVIGITSPAAGDTTLLAWMDKEPGYDNDIQDAGEVFGSATQTWGTSLADASIKFLNPSGYGASGSNPGGDRISNKRDADLLYHLVARTDAAGSIPGVEFLISSNGTTFTALGVGTRVGTTDAYELLWDSNTFNDGSYTLRVQITGTSKVEDRTVVINNDDTAASPGPPVTQAEFAFETAEMSRPANGALVPFTRAATTVAGTASASTDSVNFYYTKTAAGTTRTAASWTLCGSQRLSTTATAPQAFSGACTLNSADQASQVTGIAAIALDCDRDFGCPSTTNPAGSEAVESGDAHRVFGFDANPIVSIEPAEDEAFKDNCERFVMRVVDQTGQAIGEQNVDIHLTGPTDEATFCDPGDASARSNPGDGSHSVDPEDGQTGFHDEAPGTADTQHTEGTSNTSGRFVFGITSPDEGDSQILAWVDQTENDALDTSEGSDTATMHWVAEVGPDEDKCTIRGTQGADVIAGTGGDDIICGMGGNDVIRGKGGDDLIRAGFGKDRVYGGAGNDTVRGRQNADNLKGGDGTDTLQGGRGKDRLDGGSGQDDCVGGPGRDRVTRCE